MPKPRTFQRFDRVTPGLKARVLVRVAPQKIPVLLDVPHKPAHELPQLRAPILRVQLFSLFHEGVSLVQAVNAQGIQRPKHPLGCFAPPLSLIKVTIFKPARDKPFGFGVRSLSLDKRINLSFRLVSPQCRQFPVSRLALTLRPGLGVHLVVAL